MHLPSPEHESVRRWIAQNKTGILQLVSELVKIDTVNQVVAGTERELQHYVGHVLRDKLRMEVDLFCPEDVPGFHEHPAYFPGRNYADRPNVVGVLRGRGGGRSLLFSSHADTAPMASGWPHDPWEPVIKGERLYGLGSFDMKGGLAASIMAVRCLQELGIPLRGDVLIESVVDEEFGGANGTLACRLRGYHADAAIIPEPTNMAICPASRGGALWRVTFQGNAGMSFSGEVIDNPVYSAGTFIHFLKTFENERNASAGPSPWYDRNQTLPVIITRVEAGDMKAALCDSGPAECHIDIWVECYPGVTEEGLRSELLAAYHRYCRRTGVDCRDDLQFKKMIRFLPGSEVAADFPLISLLTEEVNLVTGQAAVVRGAPFACDAFMFNLYSATPALILGPAGGNAHAAEEFLDIPRLFELVEVYARTLLRWCGTDGDSN